MTSLAELRKNYSLGSLDVADVDRNPFRQFDAWFAQAVDAKLPEPNTMTLATVDSRGRPCGPRMPWGGCSGKLCARWRPRWCMRHRRRTPEGVSRDRGARAVLLWAHFRLRILLRSASAKVLLRGIRKTRPGAIEYSYLRDSFAFFTW